MMAESLSVEKVICMLQNCRKQKNFAHAKHVHMQICQNGLEGHRALGNYIVPTFVECGSVYDARHVFDKLVYRNEYSWTSLIRGYVELGDLHHAFNLFQKMQDDCVYPSRYTFVALLKASARQLGVETGRQIHTVIINLRFDVDLFVGSTLLDMYVKCGFLAEAQEVFVRLPVQDVVLWTALMAGYAGHGLLQELLQCFQHMASEGASPNAATFVCALKAVGRKGSINMGREVHAEIANEGYEQNVVVGNALVDMYARCGSLLEAQEVFGKLLARDVVSWNTVIAAYAVHCLIEEVVNCLWQMQQEGVAPVVITFACSMKACSGVRTADKGQEIHSEIIKVGFDRDQIVGNALVDMYAKCGLLAEARTLFDKLEVHDVVSWSALVASYADFNWCENVFTCLQEMQTEGIFPDAAMFVSSLKASGDTCTLDICREIHLEIVKQGLERDHYIGSALVDVYAKCDSIGEAGEIFCKQPIQNVVSWTALIAGYTEHELGEEALNCFQQMHWEGVPPSNVTFVCSLRACGSIGAIDIGKETHTELIKQGLEQDLSLGSTLVDLYGKCGSLLEAWEIFGKLAIRDVVTWNALTAEYADHGLGEEALDGFQLMQLENVYPDNIAFSCRLKACGRIGAICKGREIHLAIVRAGYQSDQLVGNTLVDMYVKCDSLAEAWEVFDGLQSQDIVSWNILISGCAEHGCGVEAMNCFQQMQLDRHSPHIATFVCSLKACGSVGDVDRGLEIHAEIFKSGFESETVIGNTLVDTYAKCGLLTEALEIFYGTADRDVISWTALISGYVECGLSEKALICLKQMQMEGVSPDSTTLTCSLKACGYTGAIDIAQEIHAEIARLGIKGESFLCSTLVDAYAKCGSLKEAQELFENLLVQDVVSWNALIAGYSEHGLGEEALKYFHRMIQNASPDAVTFVCSLKACGSIQALDKGQEIHTMIVMEVFASDLYIGNTLMDMYAKCGSLADAWQVFDTLPVRNEVSWNVLITGCVECGLPEEALHCLQQMQLENCSPNVVTFICSLKACASSRAIDRGKELHVEVVKQGFEGYSFIGSTLMDMYAKCGLIAEAQGLFLVSMVQDVVLWNALLAGYVERGLQEEVENCFLLMQQQGISPNIVSWNTMILGHAERGEHNSAFKRYAQMQEQGLLPHGMTFANILKACGNTTALKTGKSIHAQIYRYIGEKTDDVVLDTSLIDMYAKCGNIVEAQQVFNAMPRRVLVTWNALTTGYAHHGESELVFELFKRMREEGIQPDSITFLAVLTVCSHTGLMKEGRKYFESMKKEYKITPSIKHYTCMIDLLGRAGQLDEAIAMLTEMPSQPDLIVWCSVLGACWKWENVELGRYAFECTMRLDEKHAAAYVLMSNLYMGANIDAMRMTA